MPSASTPCSTADILIIYNYRTECNFAEFVPMGQPQIRKLITPDPAYLNAITEIQGMKHWKGLDNHVGVKFFRHQRANTSSGSTTPVSANQSHSSAAVTHMWLMPNSHRYVQLPCWEVSFQYNHASFIFISISKFSLKLCRFLHSLTISKGLTRYLLSSCTQHQFNNYACDHHVLTPCPCHQETSEPHP